MLTACIDIGNSHTKAAAFSDSTLIEFRRFSDHFHLLDWIELLAPSAVAISSVSESSIVREVERICGKVVVISSYTSLPFRNLYQTPQTLGADRIAAIAGAQYLWPAQNVLVVDAGTCITYDFIDYQGYYRGGGIAPGLLMRLKAMHQMTAQLPEIKDWGSQLPQLGLDTRTCMLVGVVRGMAYEICGWKEALRLNSKSLILTGGDAETLAEYVGECQVCPHLVLQGLNAILQHVTNK